MQYTAVIGIDDDRWAKHPYGIWIKDENGNEVEWNNGLDSRAECYRIADKYTLDFACYMDFMLNEPHAQTMPWKLRHEKIMEQYGMDIAEITLRRWTNRLIEHGVIFKSPFAQDAQWWMTTIILGEKDQDPVPDEMRHLIPEYFHRRQELYKEALEAECGDAKAAWRETYRQLWIEYGCCFYRCKCLEINGISTDEIDNIVALVTEIIEAPDEH